MKQEMVEIPKKEYERLKALEKVEWEVVGEFKEALENLKKGKFIEEASPEEYTDEEKTPGFMGIKAIKRYSK
jgi:hypothetical protein